MQGRNWILAGVAIVIGALAVIIANAYFSGVEERSERIAQQNEMVRIVVASQPLEFGTKLTDQNVKLQSWPAASVPQGAFHTVPDALKDNRVALRPIVPGEPVLASKVSGKDGRATLAALLPEGMRAMSIPISSVTGVSGFVLPGTTVDVMLTRKIEGDGASSEDMRSDVILENVQVLAVDQLASDAKGDPKVSKTATLAVTLRDAQRLTIAEKIGTLSLALRKIEEAAIAVPGGEARMASTITNRQLGGRSFYIPARRQGGSAPAGLMASAPRPLIVSAGGAVIPSAPSGPTMTVFRGVESTSYPISYLGGR